MRMVYFKTKVNFCVNNAFSILKFNINESFAHIYAEVIDDLLGCDISRSKIE